MPSIIKILWPRFYNKKGGKEKGKTILKNGYSLLDNLIIMFLTVTYVSIFKKLYPLHAHASIISTEYF